MDVLIQSLIDNPVYLAGAVVLAIVILFGFIRKLFKLVLLFSAVLVLYVAYLIWTGEDVDVEKIKEGVQSAGEAISEKAGEISETVKGKIGETVEDKLDEKVDDLITP